MIGRRLTWLVLVGLLLMGCQQEDFGPVAGGGEPEAIAFSAEMAPIESTRGINAMDNSVALANQGGFGVFGCYTGLHRFSDSDVQSDFMYNQQVTYDNVNSTWTYDPIKYWPNGEGNVVMDAAENTHYVSFFAYAPYSDRDPGNAAGYCIPTFHLQSEVTNPWLTYRLHTDPAKQVDLLYAIPLLDQSKGAVARPEIFTFRHALACVGDRVTVSVGGLLRNNYQGRVGGPTTRIEIQLTSVTLNLKLTERARLVLWTGGEANWHPITSGEALTNRSLTLKSADDGAPHTLWSYDSSLGTGGTDWTDTGNGVFYIPLHREGSLQTAEIVVGYDVVTTRTSAPEIRESKTSSVSLTLSDYGDAYQAGRHLYLNLSLTSE